MANDQTGSVVAALEHMTGPCRGEVSWISGDSTRIGLTRSRRLKVLQPNEPDDRVIATITRDSGVLSIEAEPEAQIWVNGNLIEHRQLSNNDVIEFGGDGPISRLRLYRQDAHRHYSVADIFANTYAYLRVSRRPWPIRIWRALKSFIINVALETSAGFRLTVLIVLCLLVLSTYRQLQERRELEQRVVSSTEQLAAFSNALTRAREEALTPADLRSLRLDLTERLTTTAGRVEALERLSRASAEVIAAARHSVVFLQGGYGFRDKKSGRMLRYVVDGDGAKLYDFAGNPLLTLEGEGPVAERQYSGTGFRLLDAGGMVATNRHVALPWEKDATSAMLRGQGLEPEMIRLAGYQPGQAKAAEFVMVKASNDADLALLRIKNGDWPDGVSGLRLAEVVPAPGTEVLVMGYPTGLKSMIAQAGKAFIEKIEADGVTDFWAVAVRLAESNLIMPLASRGIVGQASDTAIVYDADTTHGGSGGPVLNRAGMVVAVNTAIFPEYGGSNLGVPVEQLRRLIASVNE